MKKSEIYKLAISSVIMDEHLDMDVTIEILDVLMNDMRGAKWSEKREEEREDGAS